MQNANEFENAIERPSLETVIADEIEKDEPQDLWEKLRNQIYNRTPQGLQIAQAMITELQYRFERLAKQSEPAFE